MQQCSLPDAVMLRPTSDAPAALDRLAMGSEWAEPLTQLAVCGESSVGGLAPAAQLSRIGGHRGAQLGMRAGLLEIRYRAGAVRPAAVAHATRGPDVRWTRMAAL